MPLERYGELVTWGQRIGTLGAAGGERLRRAAAERPEDAAAALASATKTGSGGWMQTRTCRPRSG